MIQNALARTSSSLQQKSTEYEVFEEQENPVELEAMWQLVADWTVSFLRERPGSQSEILETELKSLGFSASVLPFHRNSVTGFIIALSDEMAGTAFMISRTELKEFTVVWQMKDHLVAGHQFGRELSTWTAALTQGRPGLYPSMASLPAAANGNPRFYLRSWYYFNGMTGPNQLILWELTETEARPLLVGDYQRMVDSSHEQVKLQDNILTVQTKEGFNTFYTNRASEEPRGYWEIGIQPDRIEDLGEAFRHSGVTVS